MESTNTFQKIIVKQFQLHYSKYEDIWNNVVHLSQNKTSFQF